MSNTNTNTNIVLKYFQDIHDLKIPMPFNKFNLYIMSIINQSDFIDDMNSLFRKYSYDMSIYHSILESSLVDLLTFVFHDTNEWISYWLYELDFGKNTDDLTATFPSPSFGKLSIPITSISNLYCLLIAEYNNCLEQYLINYWNIK